MWCCRLAEAAKEMAELNQRLLDAALASDIIKEDDADCFLDDDYLLENQRDHAVASSDNLTKLTQSPPTVPFDSVLMTM